MTVPLLDESPISLDSLWQMAYPRKYLIGHQALRQNLLENDLLVADGSWLSKPTSEHSADALIALKRSGTPTWFIGTDPELGHVAAWAETVPGLVRHELLPLSVKAARDIGLKRIAFGMDPDHLFPGCPDDLPSLRHQLADGGFEETGKCCDLERDLSGYTLPEDCTKALKDSHATVRSCKRSDLDGLDSFFTREFPGRWRHDVMRKCQKYGEFEHVYVLLVDGHVEGFAMTQFEGCEHPVCGAVWHQSLGNKWGALGPIGVSQGVRGKGLGNAVLGHALDGLRNRGARRSIIDWTNLVDFYGAHGFEVTRRYTSMVKVLG